MNVLIISSSFPRFKGDPRGPFVLDEAVGLYHKGLDVYVLTQRYSGLPPFSEMQGIKVYRFWWVHKDDAPIQRKNLRNLDQLLSYFISAISNAIRIVRKHKINIIYAQWTIPSGLIGMIAGWITRRPVVLAVHGSDLVGQLANKPIIKLLNKLIISNANFTIARHQVLHKLLVALVGNRARAIMIPVCIDLAKFRPNIGHSLHTKFPRLLSYKKEGFLVVMTVRNLYPVYGISYLIEAARRVYEINKSKKMVFVVVGDGPQRREIEELIARYNLKDKVILLGSIPHSDIPELLSMADIFVDPCIRGQGVASIEAMAMGKPVVGFYAKNAAVKVIDGVTGYLVPLGNTEMLAQKIGMLIDKHLRSSMAANAVKFARRYDCDRIANEIVEIFLSVISTLNCPT